MCETECVVDSRLLKNCLLAFKRVSNKKLRDGLKVRDLTNELSRILNSEKDTVFFSWAIEDVQNVRGDLSDEQAWDVLQYAKRRHDGNFGVNWEILQIHADYLFPE